jgi:hypothetical protein
MENKLNYFEDLKTIKKIMEDSSRFLSLSGLSGLFAGIAALAGSAVAFFIIRKNKTPVSDNLISILNKDGNTLKIQLVIISLIVLIIAISTSVYFSYRRSQRQGHKIWTPISKRLLVSLLIPLITGGLFIIILSIENQWQLIVPAMLIFYGLALVNAGKFTYSEVFYLGVIEILTGLISAIFPEYALLFWCLGFGLLHIAYGLFMYRKYEG